MEISNKREKINGYQLILSYVGIIFVLVGIIVLLPLIILAFYPEELYMAKCFVIPGALSIFIGYMLCLMQKNKDVGTLQHNQDTIVVVLAWVIAILVSSVPFMMYGGYTFTQAIFECTSGYSTTGLTVTDVANAPKILLFFRSITMYFGGVGLVLVLSTFFFDYYAMRLYGAEGHTDRLTPSLLKTARVVLGFYTAFIVGGTIAYIICGMAPFDAINHSICAVATGGFSTKATSIGYYNSFEIELVSIVLMLLGATSFYVHLLLIRGQFKKALSHCEVRCNYLLLGVCIPVIALFLLKGVVGTLPEALRIALFQAVSASTTTGFQTVSTFQNWPPAAIFVMILLMLVGGNYGSTAGGIKHYRAYILFKDLLWNFQEKLRNQRVVKVGHANRFGETVSIGFQERRQVSHFILVYIGIFLIGSFIFSCFGFSLGDSMFEMSSSMGGVGLSVGITSPTAHPVILWTSTVGMFMGRLEIFIILQALCRVWVDLVDFRRS